MRIAAILFLIIIAWLILLVLASCSLIIENVPLIDFDNPRADYIWGLRPDIHSFAVCILFIIIAWIIVYLIRKFQK